MSATTSSSRKEVCAVEMLGHERDQMQQSLLPGHHPLVIHIHCLANLLHTLSGRSKHGWVVGYGGAPGTQDTHGAASVSGAACTATTAADSITTSTSIMTFLQMRKKKNDVIC